MDAFCLPRSSGLQHGGFVPREWLAAKDLLSVICSQYNLNKKVLRIPKLLTPSVPQLVLI